MRTPLRLGDLAVTGYTIHRSGVRWLCAPGQLCRANQPIAYFNLSLEPDGAAPAGPAPFAEERDLQVACAPRVAGRVFYDPSAAPGGYLSVVGYHHWDAGAELAQIEVGEDEPGRSGDAGSLRLLMLAGRRMSNLIDSHSGLLPGWHACRRAYWSEHDETPVTLLSLGICDVTGVILGEQCAFFDVFAAEPAPRHFVFVPDQPIAPSAPVLLDQLRRTPAQARALAEDLQGALKSGPVPTAEDFIFAGAMVNMQTRCPILETHDLALSTQSTRSRPAEAVLLSLNSEQPAILRHKILGYHLQVLQHHLLGAGPAIRNWLGRAFESVERTVEDIHADHIKLVDEIAAATGARVLIMNRMSTAGGENISNYSPFDAPLSGTLANVASKELNLSLYDLARGRNVEIIDVDSMAADMGGGEHLPDGIHQSRALQELLREEILHAVRDIDSRPSPAVRSGDLEVGQHAGGAGALRR